MKLSKSESIGVQDYSHALDLQHRHVQPNFDEAPPTVFTQVALAQSRSILAIKRAVELKLETRKLLSDICK